MRSDVIHKAILRMVKRFLVQLLKNMKPQKYGLMPKIQSLISQSSMFTDYPDPTGLAFAIGAFVKGSRMAIEIEGEREFYTSEEVERSEYLENLVNTTLNKYTIEKFDQLKKNPEIRHIYSCFYVFYSN